eukprot:gene1701-biopygen15401
MRCSRRRRTPAPAYGWGKRRRARAGRGPDAGGEEGGGGRARDASVAASPLHVHVEGDVEERLRPARARVGAVQAPHRVPRGHRDELVPEPHPLRQQLDDAAHEVVVVPGVRPRGEAQVHALAALRRRSSRFGASTRRRGRAPGLRGAEWVPQGSQDKPVPRPRSQDATTHDDTRTHDVTRLDKLCAFFCTAHKLLQGVTSCACHVALFADIPGDQSSR